MPTPADIAKKCSRSLAFLTTAEDGDALWLAEVLRMWLHTGVSFDAAAGLAPDWRDVLRYQHQMEALRRLHADLCVRCGELSWREAARAISDLLTSYEATAWRRDHSAGRRPAGWRGLAYDYLAARGPTSWETIRRKLALLPWVNGVEDTAHVAV